MAPADRAPTPAQVAGTQAQVLQAAPAKRVAFKPVPLARYPKVKSLGPEGVEPILDTHAYLPLPEGWTLCHDAEGNLYRAFKGPPHVVMWRHPARLEEPIPLSAGTGGSGP